MPIPAPVVAAGIAAAGQGVNALATGSMNRQTRIWNEMMYGRQYEDNLKNWHLQNEYNSPEAMMQRYENAGINKHSAFANPSAGNAGSIAKTDVQGAKFATPEWGNMLGQGVTSYFDSFLNTEMKTAQLDNLKTDNLNKILQGELIKSQTSNYSSLTDRSRFDLGLESELRDTTIEARNEVVRRAKQDRALQLTQEERAAAMHAPTLANAYDTLVNSRIGRAKTQEEIKLLKLRQYEVQQTGILKRLEKELLEKGITKGDAWYFRLLASYLPKLSVADDPKYPLLYDKNIVPNK